jgi:hypothetical protein
LVEEVDDGRLTGVAVFGLVAGTIGTGRVMFVAGGSRSLIEQTLSDLAQHSVRLVIAELPDDRPFDRMRKLLLECGFQEESRIPDFYRPGIAQTFLRIVRA